MDEASTPDTGAGNELPVSAPPPKGMAGFVTGFSAFLAGFRHVFPGGKLFKFALAPMIVSAVVLIGVAIGAFFFARAWFVEWFEASWAGWLGGVLGFLLAGLLAYFLFSPVMTLFGPWFFDPICERIHVKYTGRELMGKRSAAALLKRQLFALVQSLKWTAVVLFIELPLAVFALLTLVGAAVALPVSAAIQGADLMDYPLALREHTLSEKIAWVKRNFWPALGLGTAASLCLLVPFANLFVIPAGAAGATILMIATEGESV